MIYTFPIIGAFLGWVTNYLAIKMLFHPRREIKIFGYSIQGVFPKRQKDIATSLGKLISEELLSTDDIKSRLTEKENFNSLKEKVSFRLENYLDNHLPKNYPFISLFVGSKTKGKIVDTFTYEFDTYAPTLVENYLDNLQQDFDIESMVKEKVESLSVLKLEALIHRIMMRELKFIEIVGAVVGLLVGTVQMILAMNFL